MTPSKISRIPGAPADQYPESEPVFPCWLHVIGGSWHHVELGEVHPSDLSSCDYWHPDQPEPPTERPEAPSVPPGVTTERDVRSWVSVPPAQTGETAQMDAFDRDTLLVDITLHPHREWRKAVKKGRQLERELNAANCAAMANADAAKMAEMERDTLRQQLAQVTRERDDALNNLAIASANSRRNGEAAEQFLAHLAAAESELAELRKDRERLDWLERNGMGSFAFNGNTLNMAPLTRWGIDTARAVLHQREGKL